MTYDSALNNTTWQVHRVAQGVLLDGDGRVLLCGNRWYTGKPLVWTLPGGRAEEGEGLSDALVRELREETGLLVEPGALAFASEARSVVRRQIFLACVFRVERAGGELAVTEGSGVEDLRFVAPDELESYLPSPSLGDPLRWYLANPGASARFWYFPEYATG